MARTYKLKRKSHAGIVAASVLAAGLTFGTAGAVHELAAPSPAAVVHAAAHDAPAVSWPQPGTPGGGPVTSTAPAVSGTHSHTILRTVGRLALRHVFRVHGFYVRRLHVLPWWLRRNG